MIGSLWDFSLETYRRPGVQDACLRLQDGIGADVNLLLYCCWRGAMEKGEMASLAADLATWQTHVVGGLRAVRRIMKPMVKGLADQSEDAATLRKKVAGVELEAEKLQQNMMMHFAAGRETTAPPSPGAAARNLAQYLDLLPAPPDIAALDALRVVIWAAFSEAGEEALNAALADLRAQLDYSERETDPNLIQL